MAPSGGRTEPYANNRFRVEIDGLTASEFLQVTGLESVTAIIDYREGTEAPFARKLTGLTRYSNIVLKRGITESTELYDWRQSVIEGRTERRNGAIILLDEDRNEVARWLFRSGWPCRLSGPDLDALGNEVAIETLEICHEGLVRG